MFREKQLKEELKNLTKGFKALQRNYEEARLEVARLKAVDACKIKSCYTISLYCLNCENHVDAEIPLGVPKSEWTKTNICPHCGCKGKLF